MPPTSERAAVAAEQDDDVLERTPSHPITTTLLIVSTVALIISIVLSKHQIESYVNKQTRSDLAEFKKRAVQLYEEQYEGEGGEAVPDRPSRASRKPREGAGEGSEGAPAGEPAKDPAPAPESGGEGGGGE